MSMWSKLSALFRGSVHDGAQTVVDANALRILDQEIRDADAAQGKARDELAKMVARRRALETEVGQLNDQVRKYEASEAFIIFSVSSAISSSTRRKSPWYRPTACCGGSPISRRSRPRRAAR